MEKVDCNELALKDIKINGNILGKFGYFEIEQKYVNNTGKVLEVGYTFPIIETATVVGFEVEVGDRKFKGVSKDKDAARKEYTENIVKGNSAYMMEEKTDNIFEISVGKMDVNEEVKIKIKYIDEFEIVDNNIKVIVPTIVTPKYKSNITDNLQYGKVEYSCNFNMYISKILNRKTIASPTHKIIISDEGKAEKVEVLEYAFKDFELNIGLKNEISSNAMRSSTKDEKEVLELSFMPEIENQYQDSEKEYVFIIDRSGSMSGEKIEETKKAVKECLKQIDVGDKVNIIQFDDKIDLMGLKAIEYNDKNIDYIEKYIDGIYARGGTEILKPLKVALTDNGTEKTIILFTDGQVGNEDEIIRYVRSNINKNRIFAFGIDTSINTAFIRNLAKTGHGKAEFIRPKEKIDEKVIRTFARIQSPIVENLKIDYGKNKVIDEIKEDTSLFNYEYFNTFIKIEKLVDDISLKGNILGKEYCWTINKEDVISTNIDLETIYAKKQIDRLYDYYNSAAYNRKNEYKKLIIEIAEKYNINSKFTSFISVYERDNKLYDVPEYQNTTLDVESLNLRGYNMRMKASSVQAPRYDSAYDGDLDIPCFLRKKKVIYSDMEEDVGCEEFGGKDFWSMVKEQKEIKKQQELENKKIEVIVKKFNNSENKEILTYILFAIYFWNNTKFDKNKFLEYLRNNKDKIEKNNLYQTLLCILYRTTQGAQEVLNNISEYYQKIVLTGIDIEFSMCKELKILSKEEYKMILEDNTIEENFNEILLYRIINRNN